MDRVRLKAALRRSNMRQCELQDLMKISRSSIYRKCVGISPFTPSQQEILKAVIGGEEYESVFGGGAG